MNTLDIILLVPLIFGLVRGLMRGFVIEIATLITLIAGVYGAIHFSCFAEELIKENANLDGNTLAISAFATTFIVIVLAIHLGARILQKVLSMAALGIVNRIAGGLFGLLKWGMIISFTLVFINGLGGGSIELISKESKKGSVLYYPIAQFGPMILPIITESSWYKDLKIEEKTHIDFSL